MDVGPATDSSALRHGDCVPEAARQVLTATCGVELRPLPAPQPEVSSEIIAVVSLVGQVDWAVFLGLPSDTAARLASRFAGFEIPFESQDIGDAIGELVNIVTGQVKALLDARGVAAEISLPTVMRGKDVQISGRGAAKQVSWFDSPLGVLAIGVICVPT